MKAASVRTATPFIAINYMNQAAALLAGLLLLFGLLLPRFCVRPLVLAALAAGFLWFGAFEWFRESIRKPYAITGYAYANGLLVSKMELYKKEGLLLHLPRSGDDGADLYRRACATCHSFDRYNPLLPALAGLDRDFVARLVKGSHVVRGNMPPFAGTDAEAGFVADYLMKRADPRLLEQIAGLKGRELGGLVFEKRCGVCHVSGGFPGCECNPQCVRRSGGFHVAA